MLAAVGALLTAAGPASASMPFGADLSAGGAGIDCNSTCQGSFTFQGGTTAPSDNYGSISVVVGANDGSSAAAPVSGVLVSYSLRLSTAHSGRVRVIQDDGGTPGSDREHITPHYTGDTVSVPGDGAVHTFPARLPIAQNELLGFEVQRGSTQAAFLYRTEYGGSDSGNRRMRWYCGTADGNSDPCEVELNSAIAKSQVPLQGVIEPDADADGFGDQSQDQCPGQAGPSSGCQDADGDGVPDASDACPAQSDAAAQRNPRTGCPAEPPPPDGDGDGVPDASDACPAQSDAFAQQNPRNGCPPAPLDVKAPVISSFVVSPQSFVAANTGPSIGAAATVGTHVFYKLSEAARVTLTVERKGTGAKKKGKCVRGHARHGQKRCTLYTLVAGKIVRDDSAGVTSFRFMGRLKGKQLKPGAYRLVASARDASGNTSKTVRHAFKIKRPR
jgi:Thrombospondin type 3 repeat